MSIIDMRPLSTENDEEVKETLNGVKDDQVEASTTEQPSEEESSIEDDTSEHSSNEKTVDDKPADKPQLTEEDRLEAIKKEREKLLEDISKLRRERREVREEQKIIIDKSEELDDIAEADIHLIERVLKAKGYVKKDDLNSMTYTEKVNTVQDSWLKSHPEYLPENDKDDTNWNALKSTIESYFKAPSNPKDIAKIMDLAHSMISPSKLPVKSTAIADASKEKINSSSKGSTGGGQKYSSGSQKSNVDTSYLIGFTEDEIKEITA